MNFRLHQRLIKFHMQNCSVNGYRLYTEVKVSMGFIIPSDEVARLINAMETVLRYITGLYHDKFSIATKKMHKPTIEG